MVKATKAPNQVVFFVDQQRFEVENREYSPREILELAGEDPTETTLVLKHGHEISKLTDLDRPIKIKNGTHFVVFHEGPTPVS